MAATAIAQVYGQFVTIFVLLLTVPTLLHAWGTERYAAWILLSAFPTYAALSDFGFTYAAKNEMSVLVAGGRKDDAVAVMHSVFAGLTLTTLVISALLLASFPFFDFASAFNLTSISDASAKTVLLVLVGNVFLTQYALLVSAGVRSVGLMPQEASWGASMRLAEGVALIVAAYMSDSLVVAALAVLASKIAFVLTYYTYMRRRAPFLAFRFTSARRGEIVRLLHPAVSFMLMPLATALILQGPIIVLGWYGTALQIVTFNVSRTLLRIGISAANVVSFSVMPELSVLYGAGDVRRFRSLALAFAAGSTALALAYALVTPFVAPFAIGLYSGGRVSPPQAFVVLMVLSVACEMLWSSFFAPVGAINRHAGIAYTFAVAAAASAVISYLGIPRFDLTAAAFASLAANAVMVVVAGLALRRELAAVAAGPGPSGAPVTSSRAR